jgi:hypothetical protein
MQRHVQSEADRHAGATCKRVLNERVCWSGTCAAQLRNSCSTTQNSKTVAKNTRNIM